MSFLFFLALVLPATLPAQETNCGDGVDNDGDGLIDCFDSDCRGIGNCADFFFNPPVPECGFTPPELDEIKLNLLFKTDEARYPVDQRAGVVVGDLDGDGIAELVSRDNGPPRIQIFDGATGALKQSIVTPTTHPFGQLAIADVDEDGLGDIFHLEYTGRLARYEFGNPNAVWRTANNVGDDVVVSTPQLADINQDGTPEVYVGDRIFDALTGTRLIDGGSNVNVGGYAGGSNADRFPIYYDLYQPGDARPDGLGVFGDEARGMEYIAGNQVWTTRQAGTNNFQFNLAAQYNGPSTLRDGMTSIADINGDGRMDVAVMDAGDVYAWDPYTNEIIGPSYQVPGTGSGGRINIGDFDGDGDVELGFAGRNIYIVRNYVDNDGDADPNNGTWVTLWQKTGLDDGSQRTGSTLFDFDGNGTVEVVYSEEENLFIYDGPTGAELFRTTSRSGTRTEYPIVADVNGDGTAEIIVTAQEKNGPQFSGTGWISVYESANQPWVPARDVWNQHGYNVTNINNDLTVPQFQQDNLNPALGDRYNNFLVQTSVGGAADPQVLYPAPDAVIMAQADVNGDPVIDFSDCPNTITINLQVDNPGDAPLPASTPISFYDGDPRASSPNLIVSTVLGEQVDPGQTRIVPTTVNVSQVPAGSPIFLSVNDPGFAPADLPFDASDFPLTGTAECDYTNNVSNVGNVRCGEVCGNGKDDDGDGAVDEPNLVQTQSTGCPGAVLNAITNDSPGGTYSVLGGSSIGTTVDQNGVVTLGNNFTGTAVTETIRYDDGICTEEVEVTTVDNVAPALACPGNRTVAVDANCAVAAPDLTTAAQVSDNCTATGTIAVTQSIPAGDPLSLGPNVITVTATDQSGNGSTCTVTVTAVDRINPTISCPADASVTVDAGCRYEVPDLSAGATVSDNCSAPGDITVTQVPAVGQVRSGNGTEVLVTLTARDEAGRTANCTYTLKLADTTPPTIGCPTVSDQTLSNEPDNCGYALRDYRGEVQRADNCSSFNQITLAQSPAPGTRVIAPGSYPITITATDRAGNTSTCTFNQVVLDRDPPQLVCPQTTTVPINPATCDFTVPNVIAGTTIIDNCGSGLVTNVSQTPAAGGTFTGAFQNVTVTATDPSGNSNTCVVTLLPGPPQPPSIVCPTDQLLVADADCAVPLPDYTGQATTDGCGPITVTQTPGPGTTISTATTVTLTARNSIGIAVTCTFSVDVDDQTAPTITCPAPQTIAVDGTCAVPLPDYTGQAATADNCDPARGGVVVTQSPDAGTMYDITDSPVSVTLTATDAAGNTQPCVFQVALMDNQPPTISCPVSPQTNPLNANCQTLLPDFREKAMVSSTCEMGGFTLTQVPAPGTTVTGVQTLPVTITATDDQGNAVSCTFDFVTLDVTPPTVACPANQTESVDAGCSFTLPDYRGQSTVADNCSNPAPAPAPLLTVTQDPPPGTTVVGDGTVTTITITATDAAGNSSSCDFDLTLEDTTDPELTCPPAQTRDLNANCEYTLENLTGLASATDNCSAAGAITITQSPLPGAVGFVGPATNTVTLTATDAAGNRTTCPVTVTIRDVTPPTIGCPPNPTLAVDDACMATVPDLTGEATVADNCTLSGPPTVSQDVASGTPLSGDGTTQTVNLTVTDENGLTATCAVTITLDDTTPPTVTCPAAQDLALDATGCQTTLPDYRSQLTLGDNCTPPGALAIQQMPAPTTVVMGANATQVVTFSVDDNNGNVASCEFTVTLRDGTPPAITCPTPGPLTLDGDCSVALPDFTGQAVVTDDCAMGGMITVAQSPGPNTLLTFDGQQTTVTLTAADGNGNSANCQFTVTAEDTAAPTIACPTDREETVSADCDFTLPDYTGEAAVADNCSEPAGITVTQTPAPGTVIPSAQLDQAQTITLTATDDAGNTVSCTFAVTPVDETAPSVVCPEPQTILLDAANCNATLGDYTGLATVLDNCSAPSDIVVTQDSTAGTVYNGLVPPQFPVTLTATDEAGNAATCTFTVLVRDPVDPTVDCSAANVTIALDADCNGALPDLIPLLVTDDNCSADALTVLQSPAQGAEFSGDGASTMVTFTVQDASGNEVSCTATVTFTDQSPPDPVVCPTDQTLDVDSNCPVPLPDYTGSATVLDNCTAQEDIVITQSPLPGTMVMGDGTIVPIVLTATDRAGNAATCTFDVTLDDNVGVQLTCPGEQLVIASSGNCDGVLPDYTGLVVTSDDCEVFPAGGTISQSPAPNTPLSRADLDVPQSVVITVNDGNGNFTSCTLTATLVDTLAPLLICPTNRDTVVDEACQYVFSDFINRTTITDNCAAREDLIVTQDAAPGTGVVGPNATETVTITATDPSGNQASCSFVLTITDDQPPVVTCPEPATIFLDPDCSATVGDYTSAVVADDNCTGKEDLTFAQSPVAGTVVSGQLTTTTVTVTATDGSGNAADCSFTVTAVDTFPPQLFCPGDQVIRPDADCDALIPDYRTQTRTVDNCATAGQTTLTQRPAPGTVLSGQGDAAEVTIVADDGNGNLDSCVFRVTLEDNTPPLIDCPADFSVATDADCNYDLADLRPELDVLDNCTSEADLILSQNVGIGQTFSGDGTTITVTLTADDRNGNTSQCVTVVTLEDNTEPTIACPADQVLFADAGCEVVVPDYRAATVTDNCTTPGDITVSQTLAPGAVVSLTGTPNVITLTADDGNGNTANCSFNLTVEDNTPPVIVCPADQEVFVDGDCETTLPDYTAQATATDNCTAAPAITQVTPAAGRLIDTLGEQLVTLRATDGSGNVTDCQFTVTVSDNTPPVLVCPTLSVIPADANCTITLADYRDSIRVSDNCGPLSAENGAGTQVQSPDPGTVLAGLGAEQVITILALDPSGNQSSCELIVRLVDTIPPVITCPADTTLAVDEDCAAVIPDYTGLPVTTDNCAASGNVTVTQAPVAGTMVSDEASLITITLTATDAAGNTTTCDFGVQLIDSIPPEVVCPDDDVIGVDGACEIALPDYRDAAGPTDNCSAPEAIVLTQVPPPGTPLSGDGTTQEVTIIATDESGNVDSCTLTVTLEDTTEPLITCPANQEIDADEDCEVTIPDYTGDATASSACDQSSITITQVPPLGTTISGHNSTATVTLTATDASGNAVSCSFEVRLVDRTPPVILNCQVDTVGRTDGDCNFSLPDYWALAPASAQDNCRPTGTTSTTATGDQIRYTQTPPPGTVLNGAFTTRTITLTADDGNGNTVSCDFELSLFDDTPPTIACPADTVANPDAGCAFTLEDYTDRAAVGDNCSDEDDLTVSQDPPAGTVLTGDATEQRITLTVTDESGNATTCDFLLTLADTTSPTITCPPARTENLTADCEFTVPDYRPEALIADNCTPVTVADVTQTPAPGTTIGDRNEGDTFAVDLLVDDGNGNTTPCSFTITLDDVTRPVIDCADDATVFVDADCEAELPDLVALTTATDNCADATGGSGITITQVPLATTVYNGDDTEVIVTLTADDNNGNSSQCQVTVTLQDVTDPTIVSCPPSETLLTDGDCEVSVPDYTVRATVADNCTPNGEILVTQDVAAGTVLTGDGTSRTITLTADDGNGNTTDCQLTLTLEDATEPTITCPPTQTQFTDGSCTDTLLDYRSLATTMDNCTAGEEITLTQSPASGFVLDGVGTTQVTLTADDGNGNSRACVFTVSFEDNDAPGIICPGAQTIDSGEDCVFTVPDYRELAQLSDNCVVTPLVISQEPAAGFTINGLDMAQEIVLTVTDNSGNTANCAFTVTTASPTPPPARETVMLAVVNRPTGSGTVNLLDAFDNAAESNLTGLDLDGMLDPGAEPFVVTFYRTRAQAEAETTAIPAANYDPAFSGPVVVVRIEDPSSGCFTISQILLVPREPGVSNATDSVYCSKPGEVLEIDGRPVPGGQGTTIVGHQWTLIDAGATGLTPDRLTDTDERVVSVNTAGLRSGTITLEYQFTEDYGDGPVVPSVPKRVTVEVRQVGTGDFFWDGRE